MLKPIAAMKLTANWKTVQSQNAVRVETFRPYDVAIIKVAAPFKVHGTTKYYERLMFQDGQFPYFGTAVGANLIIYGRGINVFASGQGDSAIPSVIDGKYRMGYAKPTRDEDIRFWYPSVNGQMIAGGDSGGPSFAWVLSGYALVGVHSVAHTTYVPGKPKTGWTWVTSTPEAADAPVQPVINQIFSIIGPMPPPDPEPATEPPPPGFIGTFAKTPPDYQPLWVYAIKPNGVLLWYRKDSGDSPWQGPKQVGTGWANVKDVIPAGGNAFYALTQDGLLKWYRHDGFNDGSFNWKGPVDVGRGWAFKRIFSGGEGIIYAIRQDGKLIWYRHNGYTNGGGMDTWSGPNEVGSDWGGFKDVFSTGKGAVYAVKPDGKLLLYQQKDYANGVKNWYSAREVGSGWQDFRQIVPVGDGVILAIQNDGKLLWYKHSRTSASAHRPPSSSKHEKIAGSPSRCPEQDERCMERPGSNRLRLAGCWESHRADAQVAGCPTIARRVLRSNCLTIARYSAATSSGLREHRP